MSRFNENWKKLEDRFKKEANKEGSIYLPNMKPSGKVEFVLLAMEPSFSRWAEDARDAKMQIRAGFRNFIYSYEDFILHYAVRKFLCDSKEKYHLTDISKGAMPVRQANNNRVQRYLRWLPLLKDEINLVSTKGTQTICVGTSPYRFLSNHGNDRGLYSDYCILHYSQNAAAYRVGAVDADPRGFEEFTKKDLGEELRENARSLLNEYGIPERFRVKALKRIHPRKLTPSRTALLFTYMKEFKEIKRLS